MKMRRRSMITREGWYYLFILAFVVVGSLLRHINLLVGLSAILSTAMLFNWRITRAGLRQLQFGRKALPPVWCHRPTTFEVEVHNPRKYLTSFSVMVSQRFRPKRVLRSAETKTNWYKRLIHFFRGNTVSNYVLLDSIHVGESRTAQQILEFRDRGEYEMGPLTISTHFPLGLTRREISDQSRLPLLVGPALGSLTYGWVDRMLGLGWQDASGGSTSRSGDEFYSLRPWMNGDSRRWVHWRATARHGTVLVRQFQRSQSKAFSLVVDFTKLDENSSSDELEKILRIVATISNSVREGHADTAKITLISEHIHPISFPCSEEKWTQWHRVLATITPTENPARFMEALIEDPTIVGQGAGDVPVVVVSPRSVDDFTEQIRSMESLNSSNRSAEETEHVGVEQEASALNTESQVAVAVTEKPTRLRDSNAASLWNIQRQIRTWLTPGDSRLISWYIDAPGWKEDPTDLTAEEDA